MKKLVEYTYTARAKETGETLKGSIVVRNEWYGGLSYYIARNYYSSSGFCGGQYADTELIEVVKDTIEPYYEEVEESEND